MAVLPKQPHDGQHESRSRIAFGLGARGVDDEDVFATLESRPLGGRRTMGTCPTHRVELVADAPGPASAPAHERVEPGRHHARRSATRTRHALLSSTIGVLRTTRALHDAGHGHDGDGSWLTQASPSISWTFSVPLPPTSKPVATDQSSTRWGPCPTPGARSVAHCCESRSGGRQKHPASTTKPCA